MDQNPMNFNDYHNLPLNEGTVYTTQAEKDAFLKDKTNIANYFMFNFFGMIGIMSFFQGKSPIVAYFSTDQKHQLSNITDTNTDMSLSVKLMTEAGGLTTTTATNLTKFLVLLKNKSINSSNFDEKIIRGWATEVKTSACKPSPAILAAFEDFESGKSTLAQFTKVIFYLKALKQYAPSVGIFRDMCHHAYSAFKNIPDVGSVPAVPAALQRATQPTKKVDPVTQQTTTVDPVAAKVAPTPPVVQAKVVDLDFYKKAWNVDGKAALTKLCKEYNTSFAILEFMKFFEANVSDFKLTLNSLTVLKIAKENNSSYTNFVRIIINKLLAVYPLETLAIVEQLPPTKNTFKNASYSFGATAREVVQNEFTKQLRLDIEKAPMTLIAFNDIKRKYEKYNNALAEWMQSTSLVQAPYSRAEQDNSSPLKSIIYSISANSIWIENATRAFNRFGFVVQSTPAAQILTKGVASDADWAVITSAESILKAKGWSTSADSVLDLLLENRFKNQNSYKDFVYKLQQLSDVHQKQILPRVLELLKTNSEDKDLFAAWIFYDYNDFTERSVFFDPKSEQELTEIVKGCLPEIKKQILKVQGDYNSVGKLRKIDGFTGSLGTAVKTVVFQALRETDINSFVVDRNYTVPFINEIYKLVGIDENTLSTFFTKLLDDRDGLRIVAEASNTKFNIPFDKKFLDLYLAKARADGVNLDHHSTVAAFIAKYFGVFTLEEQASLLDSYPALSRQLLRYNPTLVLTLPIEMLKSLTLDNMTGFVDSGSTDEKSSRMEFFKPKMKEILSKILVDKISFVDSNISPSIAFTAIELVGTPEDFEKFISYNLFTPTAMRMVNYLSRINDKNKNLDEWISESTLMRMTHVASEVLEFKAEDASSRKQLANALTDTIYTIHDVNPTKAEKAYALMGPGLKRATIKHLAQIATAGIAMNEIFNSDSPIKPYAKMDHKRLVEVLKYNDIPVSEASLPGYNSKKAETLKSLTSNLPPPPEIKKLNVTPIVKDHQDLVAMSIEYDAFNRYNHGDIALIFNKAYDVAIPTQIDSVKAWNEAHPTAEVISPAFHGTGSIGASMILRYGFKVINAGDGLVVGRMLGDGIYFSNVLDKVGQYVGDAGYSRGTGTRGYIFEMDANLGSKEDYSSAGVNDGRTRSPEWCVFTPNSQLRIKKAFEVEIISGAQMRQMKKAAGLTESVVTPIKNFKAFKKASSVANTHAISYVFIDGSIPVGKDKKVPFEEFKKLNLKNVRVDLSGQGPVVVISDTAESLAFVVSSTEQFLDDRVELEKFLTLIGK
jgi:hypothetical protein